MKVLAEVLVRDGVRGFAGCGGVLAVVDCEGQVIEGLTYTRYGFAQAEIRDEVGLRALERNGVRGFA